MKKRDIAIIGGGPSGLIAAELLACAGHSVTVYDRMPSLGRKFLMAGRGGLNLTHSEELDKFITRYGEKSAWLEPYIRAFSPEDLKKWCENLGQETFVGSSGRIFPKSMKASPLLRAWLNRLNNLGVKFALNHAWEGWENNALKFTNAKQETILVKADAILLALGGASWPRLGADGSWVKILEDEGVEISALRPANSGFITNWSEHFSSRFAGTPLKPVTLTHNGISQQGEMMVTASGIEGGAVYALSSSIRNSVDEDGYATLHLDLRPGMTVNVLRHKLEAPRGKQSFSNHLRRCGFSPIAISLLRELTPDWLTEASPAELAERIKTLPLTVTATTGLARAISTAGGIKQNALNENFMLTAKPGVFAAGEMLDWEAPTGGYLLQGCFSTSVAAARGMIKFLEK